MPSSDVTSPEFGMLILARKMGFLWWDRMGFFVRITPLHKEPKDGAIMLQTIPIPDWRIQLIAPGKEFTIERDSEAYIVNDIDSVLRHINWYAPSDSHSVLAKARRLGSLVVDVSPQGEILREHG